MKEYEELWSKTKDLIRLITKSSDGYYEKYIKIKFNSYDKLPLNKTIETAIIITIIVRAIFLKMIKIIHKISYMNAFINYSY